MNLKYFLEICFLCIVCVEICFFYLFIDILIEKVREKIV